MKSSVGITLPRYSSAALLLSVLCLAAQPAVATLEYGYVDPSVVLDTRTGRIWLPVDASNDDIARLGALGTDLHFAGWDALRALWAGNFHVPLVSGSVRLVPGPLDPAMIDLMRFLGGGLTEDCSRTDECYEISGWKTNGDGTYAVVYLEYWSLGDVSAISVIATIGSYPFPNPCTGGLPFACSDTRFLLMSPVPVPGSAWLLAGALCALARRLAPDTGAQARLR